MSTISSFKNIEKKHDVYRGKDCMKKFCESLREHAMKIINFFKENEVTNKKAARIIWKCKNLLYLSRKTSKQIFKRYCKVRDHCCYTGEYRGAAHSICNLKYSVPKKVPVVFHNGSNYDYHFIIKELVEEFKK